MCFNLAAAKGHREASQRRLEVAAEMSASEIAAAQRAARNWNAAHRDTKIFPPNQLLTEGYMKAQRVEKDHEQLDSQRAA
jgi:hypothetical protein